MDKMLFTAMNAASQAMQAQAKISHNLANVSTTAFKAELDVFNSWHVEGPGMNTRAYNKLQETGNDLRIGNFTTTGRELDVAIQGKGWIVVQGSGNALRRDSNEALTRAGDLRITANGQLINGAGHAVMGNNGPIVLPPSEKIEIGADGSISVIPVGQSANTLAIVDRIKLVNPDDVDIIKGDDGLMTTRSGQIPEADASVILVSGVLENSNVNAVGELTDLIQNARQFEASIKLMKTAQETDAASSRLLRNS